MLPTCRGSIQVETSEVVVFGLGLRRARAAGLRAAAGLWALNSASDSFACGEDVEGEGGRC